MNLNTKILFCDKMTDAKKAKVPSHKHDFWQMEFITKGHVYLTQDKQQTELIPPCLVIIPPKVSHGFLYQKNEIHNFSIKYSSNQEAYEDKIKVITPEKTMRKIIDTIDFHVFSENKTDQIIIEHLLNLIISQYYNQASHQEINLNARIKDYVSSQRGKKLNLDKLSQQLSYSVSYLSKYFKQENEVSLKNYIDLKRAEYAKEKILYSDQSISSIAAELDFPDLYSFSHFFKRHHHQSPRNFRTKNNQVT